MSVGDGRFISAYRDRVLEQYGGAIGTDRSRLLTPALVLDIGTARRNIDTMAAALAGMPAGYRPHIKVHKSPDLAKMQMAAGALGLSVATVWEAAVMADAGITDIFLVNTVVDPIKLRALAEVARVASLRVAIDSPEGIESLGGAARAAGVVIGAMIEVDTGMDRCGVDTAAAGVPLARLVAETPGLRLDGLTGYEGHCALTPERELRHERQREAIDALVEVADAIEAAGLRAPVISAGGTATWDWTANDPRVTEIQAGTYVVMDTFHGSMVAGFEHALSVQSSVISTPPGRIVIDAGSKAIGDGDLSRIVGRDLRVVRFDEEHGVFEAAPRDNPRFGDSVQVIPGYAPSTVNWFDALYIVDDGVVQDVWPVIPRGPGHGGLLQALGAG